MPKGKKPKVARKPGRKGAKPARPRPGAVRDARGRILKGHAPEQDPKTKKFVSPHAPKRDKWGRFKPKKGRAHEPPKRDAFGRFHGSGKAPARDLSGRFAPKEKIHVRELPRLGEKARLSYESRLPFKYGPDDLVGAEVALWLRDFLSEISKRHDNGAGIWSMAYALFGRIALRLDEETGEPQWEEGLKEERSSHMPFMKTAEELISLGRAYGDHRFREEGKQLGKSDSLVFFFLIHKVRVSVVLS